MTVDRAKNALTEALKHFTEDLNFFNPEDPKSVHLAQRMAYTAILCGAGEIGLYTLFGAYYRSKLPDDLRLLINCQWMGKADLKPDFQVRHAKSLQSPLFAVEFKLLYETGSYNSNPQEVVKRVKYDIEKLNKMMKTEQETGASMIVFIHSVKKMEDGLDLQAWPKSSWPSYKPVADLKGGPLKDPGSLWIGKIDHDQITKITGQEELEQPEGG